MRQYVVGGTIGEYATVRTGSVVVNDVRPYALVVGNPAKQIGWVCECGDNLDSDNVCPVCRFVYDFETRS